MYAVNFINVEVKLSDGSIIKGKLNVGDNKRLSDYLKHSQEQIITIVSEEPSEDSQKVFFVSRNYIVWIMAPETKRA